MDTRYLEAFYHVGRLLSFAQAAKAMRISPSAVTRQIKLLEASLKQQLFLRNPKTVEFTPEGRRLFQRTEAFFRDLELGASRKLSLGCLQTIFESRVKKLMGEDPDFWTANLERVTIGDPKLLERELKEGRLDLVLTTRAPSSAGLLSQKIGQEELRIISRGKITDDTPWIVISAFEEAFSGLKIRSPKIIEVNSFNAGLQLILEGLGAGLLPSSVEVPKGFHRRELTGKRTSEKVHLVTRESQWRDDLIEKVKARFSE